MKRPAEHRLCPFDACRSAVKSGKKNPFRADDGTCTRPPTWKDDKGHEHENKCPWLDHGRTGRQGSHIAERMGFIGLDDDGRAMYKPVTKKAAPTRAQKLQAKVKREAFSRMVTAPKKKEA